MATYLILNSILLIVAFAALKIGKVWRWERSTVYLLLLMIVVTVIFDSFIIAADIVRYDPHRMLGVRIALAPIEDICYTVMAVMLIPSLWYNLGKNHE